MGYVAVKGGTKAIEESLRRLKYERLKEKQVLDVERIAAGMRGLIDIVMSESSLYDETLAALAIKQAEGDPAEAVFLLRAYRSTLPRKHYSLPVETEEMQIKRRISASFKDIPGGQILGATRDYSHRLLDFSLMEETDHEAISWLADYENHLQTTMEHDTASVGRLPKISDYLRKEGLFPERPIDHREPDDVTRKSLSFPTSRSQRLQVLTRGETGAVTALGYAVIRGYGALHPTVGELRIGHLPVTIENPLNESAGPDDAYYIGDVCATEVEMLMPITVEKAQGKKKSNLRSVMGFVSVKMNQRRLRWAFSTIVWKLVINDLRQEMKSLFSIILIRLKQTALFPI